MTADDYLVEGIKCSCLLCNPGCFYRSTDNGLFLRYMPTKYYCFVCYLSVCFVHASVCASVQLEIHSPGNTSKMTVVRALTCTAFYYIFKLLPSFYLIENYLIEKYVFYHYIRHINKQNDNIHGIDRPKDSN